MKSTGIVRKIDQLGRVVIPIELRREYGIEPKTDMELYIDGDMLIYKVYHPRCDICGSEYGLKEYREKRICEDCIEKVKSLL